MLTARDTAKDTLTAERRHTDRNAKTAAAMPETRSRKAEPPVKTSFYIPDDLANRAERHGILVSIVARQALHEAVTRAEADLTPQTHDDTRFVAEMLTRAFDRDQIGRLITALTELNG